MDVAWERLGGHCVLRPKLCSMLELEDGEVFPGIAYSLGGRQIELQPDTVNAIRQRSPLPQLLLKARGKSRSVVATAVIFLYSLHISEHLLYWASFFFFLFLGILLNPYNFLFFR